MPIHNDNCHNDNVSFLFNILIQNLSDADELFTITATNVTNIIIFSFFSSWACYVDAFQQRLKRHLRNSHLSVTFVAGLVSFTQVEPYPVCVFLVQILDQWQRAFAQRLTHRVKEDEYQVGNVAYNQQQKICPQ